MAILVIARTIPWDLLALERTDATLNVPQEDALEAWEQEWDLVQPHHPGAWTWI